MKQLVLASGNAGKLKELSALLAPSASKCCPSRPSTSARPKSPTPASSRTPSPRPATPPAATGLPALADDSGLCVEALGGAPGVMSARFAGEPKSDARNNALLLERLAGEADRRARFYCALALVRHADDPQP
jgi:XTP/dITP diphosphohydrolase